MDGFDFFSLVSFERTEKTKTKISKDENEKGSKKCLNSPGIVNHRFKSNIPKQEWKNENKDKKTDLFFTLNLVLLHHLILFYFFLFWFISFFFLVTVGLNDTYQDEIIMQVWQASNDRIFAAIFILRKGYELVNLNTLEVNI